MEENTNKSTTTNPIWKRLISMLILGFAYGVAEVVFVALVIVQVLFGLFRVNQNEPLKKMGKQISDYMYEILIFLTFNSEHRPFPYQGWGEQKEITIVSNDLPKKD